MNFVPPPQPSRQGPGDPSIRRTWWLLAGTFFALALINGLRLVVERAPLDWFTVGLVIVAAVAAIAHRNAVAGLESRGRAEAESFARILRGLSHSVSAEAIVSAILDDLIDATAADHVVLVRRRRDRAALEATLVSRRAGVPTTTTILPLSLIDAPADRAERPPVAVPMGAEPLADSAPAGSDRTGAAAAAATALVNPHEIGGAGSTADDGSGPDHDAVGPANATGAGPEVATDAGTVSPDTERGAPADGTGRLAGLAGLPRVARRETDIGGGHTFVRRAAAEAFALLRDIGLPTPELAGSGVTAKPAEVLARGEEALVLDRLADRVQSVFGLAHTLTVPLRSHQGIAGAIVLSRRGREPWSQSARRLVRGAATETAAALERADSLREVATSASTDPLTGLPNRRYFDEFSALMSGRRRAGDAVAVLMIDIDKFKGLNDAYGHPTGDKVLRSVADAITSAVRDQDVPARVGGEEFAVLLRNPGPAVAQEVGERVRQAVRSLDLAAIGVPGVSVSVGVANALNADEPISSLVDRADRALLRAKRAGRDRVIAG